MSKANRNVCFTHANNITLCCLGIHESYLLYIQDFIGIFSIDMILCICYLFTFSIYFFEQWLEHSVACISKNQFKRKSFQFNADITLSFIWPKQKDDSRAYHKHQREPALSNIFSFTANDDLCSSLLYSLNSLSYSKNYLIERHWNIIRNVSLWRKWP